MSTTTDDDVELKDMVTQLLESSGILGKMKAQLRAHVYTTLESNHVPKHSKLSNQSLTNFLSSTSGRLIFCLVREFLEFFELDFTLSVFDPETKIGKDLRYRGRSKLIDSLGLTELVDKNSPLLSEIMRLSKVSVLKSESPTPTEISESDNTSNQPSLPPQDHSNNRFGYKDYKDCIPVDDEDSLTPSLSLHLDQPHNLHQQQPQQQQPQSVHKDVDSLNTKEVDVRKSIFADSHKLSVDKDSSENICGSFLLGDLPPLGSSASLGDLPPLGEIKRGDLPPLTTTKGGELFALTKNTSQLEFAARTDVQFTEQLHNVNNEKTTNGKEKLLKVVSEKDSVGEYSVSEDIAEDLDSFSSQSNAEQFTKEEIVNNSDCSLKADHVESL